MQIYLQTEKHKWAMTHAYKRAFRHVLMLRNIQNTQTLPQTQARTIRHDTYLHVYIYVCELQTHS